MPVGRLLRYVTLTTPTRPRMLWLLTSLASLAPSPPLRRVAPQPSVQSASSSQLFAKKDATFRAWPALNDETTRLAVNAGRRHRLHVTSSADDPTRALFEGDSLMARSQILRWVEEDLPDAREQGLHVHVVERALGRRTAAERRAAGEEGGAHGGQGVVVPEFLPGLGGCFLIVSGKEEAG